MSPPINGARNNGISAPVLKKGPWTAAEDAVLVEYVKKNGEGNWNAVQKNTGLARCGKSCRLRWTNHLRPNLKKGSFTPEEEKLIIELHSQIGNKWARMAAQLPGRTDNEIKNYWNTRIKRRIRQGLPLYTNDVTPQQEGGGGGEEEEQKQQPAEPKTKVAGTSQEKLPTTSLHLDTATPTQAANKRKASTQCQFHLPSPLLIPPHSHQQFKTTSFGSSAPLFDPPAPLHSPTSCLTSPPTTPALGSSVRFKPYETPGLSLSFPTMSQSSQIPSPRTPTGSSLLPNLGIGMGSSIQYSPLSFNLRSPGNLRLHMEPMFPPSSIYSIKSEFPSSQFYFPQIGKAEASVEKKLKVGRSNNNLLEDLLEAAHGFASVNNLQKQNLLNLHDKKFDASIKSIPERDATNSTSTSTGPMNSVQENLSKLLNSIPSAIPVSEGCSANGEMVNSQNSNNGSGLSDDGIGLEAHHIAALFPMDPIAENGRISGSYPWDTLPRIC